MAALAVAALLGLAGWQSGSLPITLAVTGGFLGVAVLLWVVGGLLLRALKPLAASRSFPVRHAVRTVLRGAGQVRVVLVALGVGVFLVLATVGIERNLRREFAFQEDRNAPDLFFLDIQADQVETVRANAVANGTPDMRLIPVLQARIHAIFGTAVRLEDREAVRAAGGLSREYTVSGRSYLEDNEELVAGEFWGERPAEGIEVSAEIELMRDHGVAVGGHHPLPDPRETLDARVTSLRDVEWRNARNGGFTFLFHPDNLAEFPMTYAGFVRGPDGVVERARYQGAVVGALPNVTVVDLRDVLDTMRQVTDSVGLAVRIVGPHRPDRRAAHPDRHGRRPHRRPPPGNGGAARLRRGTLAGDRGDPPRTRRHRRPRRRGGRHRGGGHHLLRGAPGDAPALRGGTAPRHPRHPGPRRPRRPPSAPSPRRMSSAASPSRS